MKPKFITFEGPDGSGKTTAILGLLKYLHKHHPNLDCIFTREPGGSITAESIRKVILNKKNYDMDDEVEALLYAAARRQNLASTIWPALKSNKIVFCDRYIHSSLVYQGYARGLGIEHVEKLNNIITKNTWPDITIYFDISIKEAQSRINNIRTVRVDKRILDMNLELKKVRAQLNKEYDEECIIQNKKREGETIKFNSLMIELFNKEHSLMEEITKLEQNKSCNDRLESETYTFLKKVHEGYQEVIKKYGDKIKVIDASKSKKEVLKQIIDIVESYI